MSQLSLDVAEALREIRDKELYLTTHKNFKEYCFAELRILKSYAYDLANAGGVQRDLDSAMADKSMLPKNERQLRPLIKLETPELRVQAWQRALEIAGEKPVTEADVRKVVKEIQPATKTKLTPETDPKPALAWNESLVTKFKAHGYEDVFEQPFKWVFDVAGLYSAQHQLYVRFVDALNFSESVGSLALKKHTQHCLIVVNATSNATPQGILFSTGKVSNIEKESFSPAFHFMAKQLDAVIAYGGLLYRAGELDGSSKASWSPAGYADLDLPNLDDKSDSDANVE